MSHHLALLILIEAGLFTLTTFLVIRKRSLLVGEYIGTGFHLLLMPIISALPATAVVLAAGFLWVACDVVASIGTIWNVGSRDEVLTSTFTPIRMAGHLFAAIWITLVSVHLDTFGLVVGSVLALTFAAYTLARGRIPQKALAVPGVLMLIWLLILARHVQQASS